MPTIEVSDEMYRRVGEFTKVVRPVLDDDADAAMSLGILIERGLKTALDDVIANQDEAILLESFHQIAVRHPEAVYSYVADMVGLGADLRTLKGRHAQIGFRNRSRTR